MLLEVWWPFSFLSGHKDLFLVCLAGYCVFFKLYHKNKNPRGLSLSLPFLLLLFPLTVEAQIASVLITYIYCCVAAVGVVGSVYLKHDAEGKENGSEYGFRNALE
jgi:hypothetical protein